MEIEARAWGSATWRRLDAAEFELLDDASTLRVASQLFESHGVRIGAPWHLWTEFDPARGSSVCVLERAGAIRAAVREPGPDEDATWRMVGPFGDDRSAPAGRTAAVFERLRPGAHRLELSTPARGVVESMEVVVEAGRTQRVFASIPRADDERPATLELSLSGPELGELARTLRLVVRIEGDPEDSPSGELSDRLLRPVADVVGSTWKTRLGPYSPGPRSVVVEPLGLRRSFELRSGEASKVAIEIGALARTAITFHHAATSAPLVPREVSAMLRAEGTTSHVHPVLATDGSGAHLFTTLPGELMLGCSDDAWAALTTRVTVSAGWNAAVVEVVPAGRIVVRVEPGSIELPDTYWDQVAVRRADGSRAEFGRRVRLGADGTARSIELVVTANEELELTTPAVPGRDALRHRLVVAAGERVERSVPARR